MLHLKIALICEILAIVLAVGVVVAAIFDKDICEDIEDDKVSRKYSGEE